MVNTNKTVNQKVNRDSRMAVEFYYVAFHEVDLKSKSQVTFKVNGNPAGLDIKASPTVPDK